jgi:hypothetical protein
MSIEKTEARIGPYTNVREDRAFRGGCESNLILAVVEPPRLLIRSVRNRNVHLVPSWHTGCGRRQGP